MFFKKSSIGVFSLFIWCIAASFFLYEFFLRTFVGSLAKQLMHDLGLSINEFTLLGSAYYLAYALMQIPVGILINKFGVKLNLMIGTILCASATFIFSHAHNFMTAFISRLLMGLGSSFAFIVLLVIVSDWFPRKNFAFLVGISQFFGTMGPALAGGPLIVWLTQAHLGWRHAIMYISMVGFILTLLGALFVKNKKDQKDGHLIFLTRTLSIKQQIKKLTHNKQAWIIATYSACIYVSLAVMAAVWGTDYLEESGLSQTHAASMISIAWIIYAFSCPLLGWVSDATKRRKPLMVMCAFIGFVCTIILFFIPYKNETLTMLLIASLGLSAAGQNVGFASITEHFPEEIRASALGLNNGMIILFGAIMPFLSGLFIDWYRHTTHLKQLNVHALTIGLSILPILNLSALILSLFYLQETYCKSQQIPLILKQNENQS